MAHLNQLVEKPYRDLINRLNQYQVGAPDTAEIYEILRILYTKEEARVGARFPLGPATLGELSRKTGIAEARLEQVLESMAQKGVVIDFSPGDTRFFMLTPTVFGFFEFSFMRLNSDLPLKHLAELMDRSLRREMGIEFFGSKTQMSRILIYEKNIPGLTSQVMPYEQVAEIIRHSSHLSVQTCFCRHKARHLGRACQAPLDVCMALGFTAEFLIRRGFARKVTESEMLDVLDKTEGLGLVHITDNVRDDPLFICHCCGCCCELLRGINELKIHHAVSPSRFIARIDRRQCNGCGVCAERCQVQAVNMVTEQGKQKAIVDQQSCLGCSVCVAGCKQGALAMTQRPKISSIPKNQLTRHLKIASEKGRLRHFLFYAASKLLRGERISYSIFN
jgi:Pyruvate/2-oxoacid:ferredoxin oxidoreductase delta subunit/DNA-binding MarR family transcriptional regulator